MNNTTRQTSALIYLLSAEAEGRTVALPEDISADGVFELAVKHGLGAMCASALAKAGFLTDKTTEHRSRAIRKIMLLDAERAAVFAELERRNIPHLPLKGIILKELYPSIGHREMSDNDILVDPSRRAEVREIFCERGYTVASYGGLHDDVYMKKPVYNFEMHVSLFAENESPLFTEYFADALQRAEGIDGSSAKALAPEYFYLYMKAHEYKHFRGGGTGLRSLLDTYLFLRANPTIDLSALAFELSKLGIKEYEADVRHLAQVIFSKEGSEALLMNTSTLTPEQYELLSYFVGSGTYGTEKNRVDNELERLSESGSGAKRRYLWQRLFPPIEWYKANAPFFYKHKILIPLYVVKRLFIKVILSPCKAFRELGRVIKSKGKKKNGISR